MSSNRIRGQWGEEVAARFLRKKRYKILHRNWRAGHGEIDLIAQDDDTLVFVEVKVRTTTDTIGGYVPALKKMKILRRTAEAFLSQCGENYFHHRFDIIEILTPPKRFFAEQIFHFEIRATMDL